MSFSSEFFTDDENYLELLFGSEHNSSSQLDIIEDLTMASKYDMSNTGLSYSGNPDEDLESFVSRFNDYATLKDFTDAKKLLAFNTCIMGHARVLLDSAQDSEKDTVDKIKQLLSGNFEGSSWKWAIESRLINRKQKPSESVDNFASDIMLWCRQLKKPESETLSIFVRGLLPSLRAFVMAKQPETFRNALDAAKLGVTVQECNEPVLETKPQVATVQPEAAIYQSLNKVTDLLANMSARLDKLESANSTNSTQSTASNENRPKPQRTVICWRCGFRGHKVANCHAFRDRDGNPLN
jgi:hypothetical protein